MIKYALGQPLPGIGQDTDDLGIQVGDSVTVGCIGAIAEAVSTTRITKYTHTHTHAHTRTHTHTHKQSMSGHAPRYTTRGPTHHLSRIPPKHPQLNSQSRHLQVPLLELLKGRFNDELDEDVRCGVNRQLEDNDRNRVP